VTVVVEIAGLELAGRHGALDAEREELQPFLYDVELELDEPASDALVQTAIPPAGVARRDARGHDARAVSGPQRVRACAQAARAARPAGRLHGR
jgi:hypothetical protein